MALPFAPETTRITIALVEVQRTVTGFGGHSDRILFEVALGGAGKILSVSLEAEEDDLSQPPFEHARIEDVRFGPKARFFSDRVWGEGAANGAMSGAFTSDSGRGAFAPGHRDYEDDDTLFVSVIVRKGLPVKVVVRKGLPVKVVAVVREISQLGTKEIPV